MRPEVKSVTQSAHSLVVHTKSNTVRGFVTDERGAVTVDWVVLTAGIIGLAIASIALVHDGATDLSNSTATALANADIGSGSSADDDAESDAGTGGGKGKLSGAANGNGGGRPEGAGSNGRNVSPGAGKKDKSAGVPRRGTDSQRGLRPRRPE